MCVGRGTALHRKTWVFGCSGQSEALCNTDNIQSNCADVSKQPNNQLYSDTPWPLILSHLHSAILWNIDSDKALTNSKLLIILVGYTWLSIHMIDTYLREITFQQTKKQKLLGLTETANWDCDECVSINIICFLFCCVNLHLWHYLNCLVFQFHVWDMIFMEIIYWQGCYVYWDT